MPPPPEAPSGYTPHRTAAPARKQTAGPDDDSYIVTFIARNIVALVLGLAIGVQGAFGEPLAPSSPPSVFPLFWWGPLSAAVLARLAHALFHSARVALELIGAHGPDALRDGRVGAAAAAFWPSAVSSVALVLSMPASLLRLALTLGAWPFIRRGHTDPAHGRPLEWQLLERAVGLAVLVHCALMEIDKVLWILGLVDLHSHPRAHFPPQLASVFVLVNESRRYTRPLIKFWWAVLVWEMYKEANVLWAQAKANREARRAQ